MIEIRSFRRFFLPIQGVGNLVTHGAKQQRDRPNAGDTHQGEDDLGQDRIGSAQKPRNEIEAKQPDASPVQRPNGDQKDGKFIEKRHTGIPPSVMKNRKEVSFRQQFSQEK